MDISSRLPSRDQILAVYAVIVLMIYAWTIMWFNYNLSAWMGYLNLGDLFSLFTYSMAVNFLESLLVLGGIVLFAALLPRRLFLDAFVARGAVLAGLGLGWMMLIAKQFSTPQFYPAEMIRWSPAVLAGILAAAFLFGKAWFLRKPVEFIADRAIIFLYLSIPLSVLSVLAVLVRNIL